MEYGVHIRDPRPIKDEAFQRTRIQKLVNFLIQSGFHSKKSVPAYQQVFQDIFKFLYLKLEPGHEFQKKVEDEVPSLLTIMRLAKGSKKKGNWAAQKRRREKSNGQEQKKSQDH
ncbi:MAG: HEC/Ndc80p family-domain-containing protein [Benniella sp.]|nr:MAG: HEC/Ndc80p family-domain-containing protein [Benniella sp.]